MMGKGLSCPMGPSTIDAAQFWAVEEAGSCRIALVVSQRQLVAGGLRSGQSRMRATVTLVERSTVGELAARGPVALWRRGRLPGPGMPGGRPLSPKPLWGVRGVRLQWQDVGSLPVAILARADGTSGPAPKEKHTTKTNRVM